MKLYILLFFILFLAFTQNTHKFQTEVFTCNNHFANSTTALAQNNSRDKAIDDANQITKLETVVINSERNFKTKKYGF